MRPLFVAAFAALAGAGCALTSKSDALDIHYFTAEPSAFAPAAAATPARGAELRLGRVVAGDNLHERIAFSDGSREVGYYDDRRWTERPDFYVRRALIRALYERHGLEHVVGGEAPTLDVDVISFEEVKTKTKHAVRIELGFRLSNDRSVVFEGQRTVEEPVSGGAKFDAVAAAMAAALADASEQVATTVVSALEKHPNGGPAAPTTSAAR